MWLVQECRRHWQRHGREYTYPELTEMAARVRPFPAVLDPDYKPFGFPGEMPLKIE